MAKLSLPTLPFKTVVAEKVAALIEKVAALSRTHRVLICVGVFLILTVGFFYLAYIPKSSRCSELKDNYDTLETKLIKARAAAKSLNKFQREYKEAQVKFRVVLRLLPDKKEIPSLLESISKSGKDSGLEFILFRPTNEVSKDFYAEIPVNIHVNGGYHNLAMFFDRVARLPRIVNISNIKMQAPEGKGATGRLSATCVARTYRFLEAPGAKPTGGKSKKRK